MKNFFMEFWKTVASQDKDKLRQYFWEDASIRWHCTNEAFTVDEYIIANCEYPGTWNGEVERIVEVENNIITVTRVWSEDMSCHATSFFKMEKGKIKELDEYFGDDGAAPKWRLNKAIGQPIK